MDIYEAAGYDAESFSEVRHTIEAVIGTDKTPESVVRDGVKTFDRDSYVAGLLIGISMERTRLRGLIEYKTIKPDK